MPEQALKGEHASHPPFFIVGSPRTGTKLLRAILSSHSRVAIPKETFYFSQILKRAKHCTRGSTITDLSGFLRVVKTFKHTKQFVPIIEEITFDEGRRWSVGEFLSELCSAYARSLGKPRWGEKTPNHLWYWKTIDETFPGCKFIVTVRDGRDVVCSMGDVHWSSGSIYADAFRWKIDVNKGLRLLGALGPRRAMQLSYEELVTEPEKSVSKVCRHLGITFEPPMLEEFEDTLEMVARRSDGTLDEGSGRIYTASIRRFERDLDPRTLSHLTCLLSRELKKIEVGEEDLGPPRYGLKWAVYIYSGLQFCNAYGRKRILK